MLSPSSEVRDGDVSLAQSRQRTFHSGVKNYNEVPAQSSSLAPKRRTLVLQWPLSACPLERWHKWNDVVVEQHHFPSMCRTISHEH